MLLAGFFRYFLVFDLRTNFLAGVRVLAELGGPILLSASQKAASMTTPSTTKEANGFYFPRMVHYPDTLLLLNTDPTAQALLDQASAAYYCQGLDDIGNLDYDALLAALSIFKPELYPESSFDFFKKVWPARKGMLDKAYESSMAKSKTYSENGAKGGRPRKSDPEPGQLEPEVKPAPKPNSVVKPSATDAEDKFDVSPEVDELFAFIKGHWPKDRLNDLDIFELGKLLKYYDIEQFKENVVQYLAWRSKQEDEKGEFKGYHFANFLSDELFRNYTKKYQGKTKKAASALMKKCESVTRPEESPIPELIKEVLDELPGGTDGINQDAKKVLLECINRYGTGPVSSAFRNLQKRHPYRVREINVFITDELEQKIDYSQTFDTDDEDEFE